MVSKPLHYVKTFNQCDEHEIQHYFDTQTITSKNNTTVDQHSIKTWQIQFKQNLHHTLSLLLKPKKFLIHYYF